jgi:hypothetical protein
MVWRAVVGIPLWKYGDDLAAWALDHEHAIEALGHGVNVAHVYLKMFILLSKDRFNKSKYETK